MKKFNSKIDVVPLIIISLFIILGIIAFLLKGNILFAILFPLFSFLWFLLVYKGNFYKIKENKLYISFLGISNGGISIEKITKVVYVKRKLIKWKFGRERTYGNSMDCILIFFINSYNEEIKLFISPKEKDEFVAELLNINPAIIIEKNSIRR